MEIDSRLINLPKSKHLVFFTPQGELALYHVSDRKITVEDILPNHKWCKYEAGAGFYMMLTADGAMDVWPGRHPRTGRVVDSVNLFTSKTKYLRWHAGKSTFIYNRGGQFIANTQQAIDELRYIATISKRRLYGELLYRGFLLAKHYEPV